MSKGVTEVIANVGAEGTNGGIGAVLFVAKTKGPR